MEAYKALYLIRDLAKSMSDIGIKMDDYRYLGFLVWTSSAITSIAVSASE